MNLESLGRTLIGIAAVLLMLGLILVGLGRLGINRLPGDIFFRRGNTSVFFPIVTGIIISVILTIVVNLLLWWTRR
jgi:hypothetical protein